MSTRRLVLPVATAALFACAGAAKQTAPTEPARSELPPRSPDPQPDASQATDDAFVPRAVAATLPSIDIDSVTATEVCAHGTCVIRGLGVSDPRSIVAQVHGEAPHAVAWLERIAPGATLRFARREGVDLLGVVIAGEASLALEETPSNGEHAGPWTAFLLPGGGASIRAVGNGPVLLALAGAGEPMRARASLGDAHGPRAPGAAFTLRPLAGREDLAWGGGAYHARLAFGPPESTSSSLEVLIAGPDAPTAVHDHADAWEIIIALESSGNLHVDAPSADQPDGGAHDVAMRPGSVAFIPPGVRHAWRPDGTVPLVAVQLYTPPGPEQRFRALADAGTR